MKIELVHKAKAGSHAAFTKLYHYYFDRTYTYMSLRTCGVQEAEDLVAELWQQVFVKLWTFRGERREVFEGWLFTVARNILFEFYRSKGSEPVNLELVNLANNNLHSDIMAREDLMNFIVILRTFSLKQQEMFILRYVSDLQHIQIANLLGVEPKTVSGALSRMVKKLEVSFPKIANFDY